MDVLSFHVYFSKFSHSCLVVLFYLGRGVRRSRTIAGCSVQGKEGVNVPR